MQCCVLWRDNDLITYFYFKFLLKAIQPQCMTVPSICSILITKSSDKLNVSIERLHSVISEHTFRWPRNSPYLNLVTIRDRHSVSFVYIIITYCNEDNKLWDCVDRLATQGLQSNSQVLFPHSPLSKQLLSKMY